MRESGHALGRRACLLGPGLGAVVAVVLEDRVAVAGRGPAGQRVCGMGPARDEYERVVENVAPRYVGPQRVSADGGLERRPGDVDHVVVGRVVDGERLL